MAESKEPTLADQYELGEQVPAESTSESVSSGPGEVTASTSQASSRPRNPDGTFAKPASMHSARLANQAKELGVTAEEINDMSPEELRDHVRDLRLERAFRAQQETFERALAPRSPQAESPLPVAPGAESVDANSLGIDETQFDDDLIKVFKAQQGKIAALEAKLDQMIQFQVQRNQETLAERCDRAFAKHESFLGKASRKDLKEDSPEFLRRRAVLGIVEQMGDGPLEDRIDRAVEVMFGKASPAPAREESQETDAQKKWREAGLGLPTHRAGSREPAGRGKAERTVAAYLRDNGSAEANGGPDEFLE